MEYFIDVFTTFCLYSAIDFMRIIFKYFEG